MGNHVFGSGWSLESRRASKGRRDEGPVHAKRTFVLRGIATRFARKLKRKHPEVRVHPSGRNYVVTWKTKETR